jgi:hypothetical protein
VHTVLVNADGWIVTAGHVLKQLVDLGAAVDKTNNHAAREAAIRADTTIDEKTRRSRLKALGHLTGDDFTHVSAFWGGSPTLPVITDMYILEAVDVGIGKLLGFVPSPGQTYPTFKDPTKDFDAGTSLCELGVSGSRETPEGGAAGYGSRTRQTGNNPRRQGKRLMARRNRKAHGAADWLSA